MDVIPNARELLCTLYNKTISLLAEMPSQSVYRQNTERIIKQRLKVVSTETDDKNIESILNDGQMEELVDKAKRECNLTEKMIGWEPWKPSLGPPPPGQWKWPIWIQFQFTDFVSMLHHNFAIETILFLHYRIWLNIRFNTDCLDASMQDV